MRTARQNVTVQNAKVETRGGTRRSARCVPGINLQTMVNGDELVRNGEVSDRGGVKARTTVVNGCEKQVVVPVTTYDIIEEMICQ